MNKKNSNFVAIVDDGDSDHANEPEDIYPSGHGKHKQKEEEKANPPEVHIGNKICIERAGKFSRVLTPKEAFRVLSHKFHGKEPGKRMQEKRLNEYQLEMKLKQMESSDIPLKYTESSRSAQAELKTAYLVVSGEVKPGQTTEPRSIFATLEKDLDLDLGFSEGLSPMLVDEIVELFLRINKPQC